MKNISSKKIIMGLAALLVLFFHFWIPQTKAAVIVKGAFIGVDLFFFVSAWSLGKKEEIKFGSFMINRLSLIYVPFVILAIIALIYNNWSFKKFVNVLFSIDLFKKGGGAFLWYLIAILFVYALVPFLLKLKKRFGFVGLAIMIGSWAILTALLQYAFGYTTIFVLLNRLPVFFIGLYYSDIQNLISQKIRTIIAVVLLIAGAFLIYRFGTTIRLNVPFVDFYYITAIPMVLGLVELIDLLVRNVKYPFYVLSFLGQITLEIYGLQMIFGYNIESALLKAMGRTMGIPAFIVTILILIAMAFIFHLLLKLIRDGFAKLFNKTTGVTK